MSDLQELTEELLQDPEFKKEYEAIQPELDKKMDMMNRHIAAHKEDAGYISEGDACLYKDGRTDGGA